MTTPSKELKIKFLVERRFGNLGRFRDTVPNASDMLGNSSRYPEDQRTVVMAREYLAELEAKDEDEIDRLYAEPLPSLFGVTAERTAYEEFHDDSFVIVNEAIVLDMTPVASDDGDPEFSDDPTIVSLYIGLFNMLKNRSNPV